MLKRQRMLGEELKRAVMEVFQGYKAMGVPIASAVTITNVSLSPDLKVAKLFFYSFLVNVPEEDVRSFFEMEKKNIRFLVAKKLGSVVRFMPELVFMKDKMLKAMEVKPV